MIETLDNIFKKLNKDKRYRVLEVDFKKELLKIPYSSLKLLYETGWHNEYTDEDNTINVYELSIIEFHYILIIETEDCEVEGYKILREWKEL